MGNLTETFECHHSFNVFYNSCNELMTLFLNFTK